VGAARSFLSYYGQRLSVAVTVGVAIEIAAYARGLHAESSRARGG
jgi:hypothetical protein